MDMEIGDFIASIGQSISDAQQTLEQQSVSNFFDYFDGHSTESNGEQNVLQPKTETLILPSAGDVSKTEPVQVPIAALMHHSHIRLESVKVKMKMNLSPDRNNDIRVDLTAPQTQDLPAEGSGEVTACSDQDELELVFQVSDPSEGIARVAQNITKTL